MRIHLHIGSQGILRLLDGVVNQLLQENCDLTIFVVDNVGTSAKKFSSLNSEFIAELHAKAGGNGKISFEQYSPEFMVEIGKLRELYFKSNKIYLAGVLFFRQKALKNFTKPWRRYRSKFRTYLPVLSRRWIEIQALLLPTRIMQCLHEINSMSFASSEYVNRIVLEKPDLVLVSPVVSESMSKIISDSCKHAEIPSVGVIASWDNLTIKGPLLCDHSKYFVWGCGQVKEAIDFHHFRENQFEALGPYPFTHLARAKLQDARFTKDSERIVWLMSSNFIVTSKGNFHPEVLAIEEFLVQAHCRDRYDLIEKLHIRIHPQTEISPKDLFDSFAFFDSEFNTNFSSIEISKSQNLYSQDRLKYSSLLNSSKVCIGFATTSVFESAFLGKKILIPPVDIAKAATEDFFHGRRLLSNNGGPAIVVENWGDFFQQIDEVQRTELQQDFTDFFGLEVSPEQACNNFVTELKSLILDKEIK